MGCIKASLLPLVVLIGLVTLSKGIPRKHNHDMRAQKTSIDSPMSRGYIDIDGSDPFNIPKHSQYIKGPTPEFTEMNGDREPEDETNNHHAREHKDTPPSTQLDKSDAEEISDLAPELQKDFEKGKGDDSSKDYLPKEMDPLKEESNIEEELPLQDEDPNTTLATLNQMELTNNQRHIEKNEQDFHARQQNAAFNNEELQQR